jgi:hypothetical protein
MIEYAVAGFRIATIIDYAKPESREKVRASYLY